MIKIQLYWTKLDFHSGQTVSFSFSSCLFLFFFLIFFMSVLLLLFVYVFFFCLFFLFCFVFCFFVFFNTIFILHASVSSISVVSRVRTPALILAPEQRLVIEPNASIHSLCYLLFAFFIHFTRLFLFFIFPCCFSLFLPLFFLFHLICFKRMVFSGILVLQTSWWFRAQADSLPRLFFGVFHLILRTFLFRFAFLKFITNCETFLSFLKSSFLTTIDGKHSRLESLLSW